MKSELEMKAGFTGIGCGALKSSGDSAPSDRDDPSSPVTQMQSKQVYKILIH